MMTVGQPPTKTVIISLTTLAEPILYSEGASRIYGERTRQIREEGYDGLHDQNVNSNSQLAIAGALYAFPGKIRDKYFARIHTQSGPPIIWPWKHDDSWKPAPIPNSPSDAIKNRIRELEKAGGLIAAEIDRLLDLLNS
jgi:hypothetical protein